MSAAADALVQTAAQRDAQLAQAAAFFRTLVDAPEAAWRPVSLPPPSDPRPHAHVHAPANANASSQAHGHTRGHTRVDSARSAESDAASRLSARELASATSSSGQPTDHTSASLAGADPPQAPFRIAPLDSPTLVAIHKRPHPTKGPDVYRAVVRVPYTGSLSASASASSAGAQATALPHLEGFRTAFATSDVRPEWDALVESSELIEMPAPDVRVTKTNFRLGWPTSPRDAITVSRTFLDPQARRLVDLTTSIPPQPDSPAYLRPSPPYVRSHIHLAAWVLELPPAEAEPVPKDQQFIHLTAFWCWTLKGAWLGLPTGGLANHLGSTVCRLVQFVRERGDTVPLISDFGHAVDVEHTTFDASRDTLAVDYSVLPDAPASDGKPAEDRTRADPPAQMDVSPDRMMQLLLSPREGWNIKIRVRGTGHARVHSHSGTAGPQGGNISRYPQWRLVARRSPDNSAGIEVTILHDRLWLQEEVTRVSVQVQRIAASTDIRLNGDLVPVWPVNPRNALPLSVSAPRAEGSSTDSVRSGRSGRSVNSERWVKGTQMPLSVVCTQVPSVAADLLAHAQPQGWVSLRDPGEAFSWILDEADKLRTLSFEGSTLPKSASGPLVPALSSGANSNAIDALIRRTYIYFTSLLQEPDAKWKHVSDSRGVTITQLDSIDPTLIVYRAEATFVGVGVWDLFATISNPGTQALWDKSHADSTLLADLNDLSSLWLSKTKASWPMSDRDSVTVNTSYKSPASVHIFSFSTDDRTLFPQIPPPEPGVIRTQVDLRGWSVESLSPTTAHVTLLEQSDPKGWTSKSSTPNAMTAAVTGVGEYAIKFGGPPVVTRLLGARVKNVQYEHERATFRFEYELSPSLLSDDTPNVECELRCDLESWSPNLDLVIDPPPIEISCLRRHKLSQGGGGLWITIEHVPASLEDDTAKITVRRGPAWGSGKERGVVMVNGANIHVDIDELEDDQVKELFRRKRSRPKHVPLDLTSPAFNGARGQRASPSLDNIAALDTPLNLSRSTTPVVPDSADASADKVSTVDSLRASARLPPPRNPLKDSLTGPLDVLFLLRRLYAERSPDPSVTPAGWALVSERNGLHVRRKYMQSISPSVAIQRADKVVQGLAAEEILQAVESLAVRTIVDERMDTAVPLQSYGNGAGVYFATTKPSFPFRGRAFCVAHLTARTASPAQANHLAKAQTSTHRYANQALDLLPVEGSPDAVANPNKPIAYFYAAASCSWKSIAEASGLSLPSRKKEDGSPAYTFGGKLNPTDLPVGRVLIDGWILETVDPYTSTAYAIPSTRLTHVMAIDFGGSVPSSVNTSWNAALPKTVNLIEAYLKGPTPNSGVGPTVNLPPSSVVVLGDGRDEDPDLPWALTLPKGAENRTLLFQDFCPRAKRFEARALLRLPAPSLPFASPELRSVRRDPVHYATMREPRHAPPRQDRRALSFSASNGDSDPADIKEFIPALRPVSNVSPSLGSDRSLATSGTRSRTTSHSASHSAADASPISLSSAIGEARRAVSLSKREGQKRSREDIVLEVTVELGHFPQGYTIQAEAVRVPPRHPAASSFSPGAELKASHSRTSSHTDSLADGDTTITHANNASSTGQSDVTLGETTPRPDSGLRERNPEPRTPLNLDADRSTSPAVPLEAAVYDLPPSALLAATLDSQHRPRRHLVRIYLAPDEGATPTPEQTNWTDALLTCVIVPRTPPPGDTATFAQLDEDSDEELPAGENGLGKSGKPLSLVWFNGMAMDVMHVNKTSALLQRENPDADPVPVLCKLTEVSDSLTEPEEKSYIPTLYEAPLAAHLKRIALPESPEERSKKDTKAAAEVKKQAGHIERPGPVPPTDTSEEDTTTVESKEATAKESVTAGQTGSNPSPIISLLANSPLSRFGQSISDSTSTTRGDQAHTHGRRRSRHNSTGSALGPTAPGRLQALFARPVCLSTVVLIALVFFLFGSFLRSLQAPADFIVFPTGMPGPMERSPTESARAWELRRSLTPEERRDVLAHDFASELRKIFGQDALPDPDVQDSPWRQGPGRRPDGVAVTQREIKRVLQIKRLFGGWDMIVAFARN